MEKKRLLKGKIPALGHPQSIEKYIVEDSPYFDCLSFYSQTRLLLKIFSWLACNFMFYLKICLLYIVIIC